MELLEGVQFSFEVCGVELVKVLVTEDPVLLQFLLEEVPDLLGVEILYLQEVSGVLCRLLNVDLLLVDDLDAGAEEPILASLSDNFLLQNLRQFALGLDHAGVLIDDWLLAKHLKVFVHLTIGLSNLQRDGQPLPLTVGVEQGSDVGRQVVGLLDASGLLVIIDRPELLALEPALCHRRLLLHLSDGSLGGLVGL